MDHFLYVLTRAKNAFEEAANITTTEALEAVRNGDHTQALINVGKTDAYTDAAKAVQELITHNTGDNTNDRR